MTHRQQSTPVPVPRAAKRAGNVRARWAWAEASVWTDRMLMTLEQGVKGTKWFSLIDKVYREENLFSAFVSVAQNQGAAGLDHVSIDDFARRLPHHMKRLSKTLGDGSFRPQAVRRVWIPKPGSKEKRPLGIPTVRDRVVQAALRNVLEPIFERDFAEHSYGFRPHRGCKDALRRVDRLVKRGYRYVVDADLKSYFDTIPHDRLLELIGEKVSDGRVLELLSHFLQQQVMDGLKSWTPAAGSPQGAVISPLLSNIYLDPLDHMMAERGFEMVRYADDFVILCRSEVAAREALDLVREWVADNGLTLHPEKTRITDTEGEGFEFLGYHFRGEQRWPRKKSLQKLKDAIRSKTRRSQGRGLQAIIADVNRTLRGWFAYFQHSRRGVFPPLDGWIRMRLRSILRKWQKKSGRGRGSDHQRWPNRFFTEAGLYSLVSAWHSAHQSSPR